MFLCSFRDGYKEFKQGGRIWRCEFHRYMGLVFCRKDGCGSSQEPAKNNPVWRKIKKWTKELHKKYKENQ